MKEAGVSSILIAVVLLAVGGTAEAQQPKKVPRIGYLSTSDTARVCPFRGIAGLRELGYVEGKNIVIEYRMRRGSSIASRSCGELVGLKVDVIVTAGTTAIRAAKEATKTIPIVMIATRSS